MKDLMAMMQKAQELQSRMGEMQAELQEMEVEGQAGGGLVTVTVTGKGALKAIRLDPSLLKPEEAEILEDLIVAAQNDARGRAEALMNDKMREMTAGLPLPPGMKFPF